MESSTIEKIVRGRFGSMEGIGYYNLSTTSPIKKLWPISTTTSTPLMSPSISSPSAATRRTKTLMESNSAYYYVLPAIFSLEWY